MMPQGAGITDFVYSHGGGGVLLTAPFPHLQLKVSSMLNSVAVFSFKPPVSRNALLFGSVLILVVAFLSPLAAAADAKPDRKTSAALGLAVRLAERIEDADFQAQLKDSLVEFQLEQGQLQAAAELATTIPDYRRGVVLAKVAAGFGHAGRRGEVARLVGEALARDNFPHSWQLDAVRAEAAIAWAADDDSKKAAGLLEKLTDEAARIRARSGIALEKVRRGQPYDEAVFQFPAAAQPAPERLPAARALIGGAQVKLAAAGKDQEAMKAVAPLCAEAEAILKTSRATAGEEYLDLGILWRRMGDLGKSAELLGQALRQMPPGFELQDWREGYFAKLVRVYLEAGDQPAVEKMLATARRGIEPLHAFYRPPALCQLAEAELAAGQPEMAEQTWLEATAVARANPNPASQYLGCAQVAFSVARAHRPLAPKLKEMLSAQLGARESKASVAEK